MAIRNSAARRAHLVGRSQDRRAFPLPGFAAAIRTRSSASRSAHRSLLEPDLDKHSIDGVCTTLVEAVDETSITSFWMQWI